MFWRSLLTSQLSVKTSNLTQTSLEGQHILQSYQIRGFFVASSKLSRKPFTVPMIHVVFEVQMTVHRDIFL